MSFIVITGASRGIGAAIAKAFAALHQYSLCLVARDEAALQKIKAECEALGSPTDYYLCDMNHPEQIQAVSTSIMTERGIPQILINNAGHYAGGSFIETSEEMLLQQVQVNCLGPVNFTRSFLPGFIERQSGDILCMGSVASIKGFANCGAYVIAKHALLGYCRSLREELKPHGIRVTAILPGAVLTDAWSGTTAPPERLMRAEDIANSIVAMTQLSPQTVVEEIILRPQEGDLM